jgi:FHA domain-containing protein
MQLVLTVARYRGAPPSKPLEARFGTAGGTIGRGRRNTLILPDTRRWVSSIHARILWRNGGFWLVDDSTNGTVVNPASRISPRQRLTRVAKGDYVLLQQGDEVWIGGFELTVALTAEDDPATTPDAEADADLEALDDDRMDEGTVLLEPFDDGDSALPDEPMLGGAADDRDILDVIAAPDGPADASHGPGAIGTDSMMHGAAGRGSAAEASAELLTLFKTPAKVTTGAGLPVPVAGFPLRTMAPMMPGPLPETRYEPSPVMLDAAAGVGAPARTDALPAAGPAVPEDYDVLADTRRPPAPSGPVDASSVPTEPPAVPPRPSTTRAEARSEDDGTESTIALPDASAAAAPMVPPEYDILADAMIGPVPTPEPPSDPSAPAPPGQPPGSDSSAHAVADSPPVPAQVRNALRSNPTPSAVTDAAAPPADTAPAEAPVAAVAAAATSVGADLSARATPRPPSSPPEPSPVPAADAVEQQTATETADMSAPFLSSLGLDPKAIPAVERARVMASAGSLLRRLTAGLIEGLVRQRQIQAELFLPTTESEPDRANPFRCSAAVDETLSRLLMPPRQARLPATKAADAAFAELRRHDEALRAALQASVEDLTARLDPLELAAGEGAAGLRQRLAGGGADARAWRRFVAAHEALCAEMAADPAAALGPAFADAYRRAMRLGAGHGGTRAAAHPGAGADAGLGTEAVSAAPNNPASPAREPYP